MLLGLLGGVAGFFYAKSQKPKYTAKLTFALAESGDKSGGLMSIASQFGVNMGSGSSGAFNGDNVLELMKSRFLIEKTLLTVVDSCGKPIRLVNHFIDASMPKMAKLKIPDTFRDSAIVKESIDELNLTRDSFLAVLCENITQQNLKVSKIDRKLAIVLVSLTSEDEWFSKNFVEILTKNVTEFYLATKMSQFLKNINMMEHKVDSIKMELGRAMYGMADQSDGNQYLVRGVGKVPMVKKQMDVQVLTLAYGEIYKNLELNRTLMAKEQPLIQVIDAPRFPLEKNQLSKIMSVIISSLIALILGSFFLINFRK
jgi:uncharacterized membrane protein (UPF0136 family)